MAGQTTPVLNEIQRYMQACNQHHKADPGMESTRKEKVALPSRPGGEAVMLKEGLLE